MTRTQLYFDHNADAKVSPAGWAAYAEAVEDYGNPSSAHQAGRQARARLEQARAEIGRFFGVAPQGVLLTSGGTESDAMALWGIASAGAHIVSTTLEHPAILENLELLKARRGVEVTLVPAGPDGVVSVEAIERALQPNTSLVSLQLANNETGVIQPVCAVAQLARARGILVHSDAVQAVGRMPVTLDTLGVDMLSISAHKFGGVGGTGALIVAPGIELAPLLVGGGQEGGHRSGTENVAGAASMAAALAESADLERALIVEAHRDELEALLTERLDGIKVVGADSPRLCNTSSMRFVGCPGDALLMALDIEGLFVSVGSACSSGSIEPSPVLLAMGLEPEKAREVVRFSLPMDVSRDEIERAVETVVRVVNRIRTSGQL